MAYSYGIKNTYRPTTLIPNAYGWSTRPQYARADVPTALVDKPKSMTDDQFRQQFAYEWFQSGQINGDRNLSNPPFVSGAAGRLHPALRDTDTGMPARILRGYIRRAQSEAGDMVSKARLYFMFNPETIQRDYVSYLNQSALDPFNTVFQSGNLVAPPSFMDFSFSLFFDRQEEATDPTHPGVFVDYQFFDLVVRNVIPQDPNQASNTLPDNGVMMVNPRDISVIFSPQLTVQGRPLNASVNFEKFTHRMTPTRMTITLTVRVIYIGPVRDMGEYRAEELQAEAAIPFGEKPATYDISFLKNEEDSSNWFTDLLGIPQTMTDIENLRDTTSTMARLFATANDANHQARLAALNWAMLHVRQGGPGEGPWTDYEDRNSGAKRYALPESADCSGLVTEAYIRTGNGTTMGWNSHPGTGTIIALAKSHPQRQLLVPLSQVVEAEMLPGDLLIREGHIAFYIGNGRIFDAAGKNLSPEVGERNMNLSNFTHVLRPTPVGSTSSAAGTSTWNRS